MKKLFSISLLLLFITFCQSGPEQSIPDSYDMTGYVIETKTNSDGEVTILVDGRGIESDMQTLSDYGWTHISSNTDLYLNGAKIDAFTFEPSSDVRVFVTYDGMVAESYPIQGGAKIIFIEEN